MDKSEHGFPTNQLNFPISVADWHGDRLQATLDAVYRRASAAVQDRIDWYDRKANTYGRQARWLRFTALVFVAIGALAPLVDAAFENPFGTNGQPSPAAIGYIALALAGTLVMVDNFFGISASWMRYRVTQATLVRRLARFRFEWAHKVAVPPAAANTADGYSALVEMAKQLVDAAERVVQEETETWAERFAARVNAFDRIHHFERYDAGTGILEVELANPEEVDLKTVAVSVNNDPAAFQPATRRACKTVEAGPVVVDLHAQATNGRRLAGSAKGAVTADQILTLKIDAAALPD